MAKSSAVWGIEIGQTALKALRCKLVDGEVVADAFDLIEYPKILSQADADVDVEEYVGDALTQLIERNEGILKDPICVSVPGQSGLAKFFKPPPVEIKKVADIVRYEARQQIPFDLADVIWDFQMMPGSMIEDGYALESEVGLFAMKREMAYRQLAPFQEVDIEVGQVQLAPISLFNMLTYDRMHERVDGETFNPDEPPPSVVFLSIGTDSSDLIVTNGFRIWQRSMPIGGNHFTRQLSKDLKLTFAKAEHLKRNAREAVDPKLIFQTMRPIFNDLVTEVQRSIGFYRSLNKNTEIAEMLVAGNTVKMPGLAAYLGKNLGFEVEVIDRFNRLGGEEEVLSVPAFRDNAPTFGVCYGLCLQGLGIGQVHTSLVPKEILLDRLVRSKKPWTIAALACLLVGMTGHYLFTERSWATTEESLWKSALASVTSMQSYSATQIEEDSRLEAQLKYLNQMGKEVSGNAERRLQWLEIMKVVNEAIPRLDPDGGRNLAFDDRKDFQIEQVETRYYGDLKEWFSPARAGRYRLEYRNWARITGKTLTEEQEQALTDDPGPEGAGWVIQLSCYHFYNSPDRIGFEEANHVRRFMTTNFLEKTIEVPIGVDDKNAPINETFTMQEMGVSYPMLLDDVPAVIEALPNPKYDLAQQLAATDGAGSATRQAGGSATKPEGSESKPAGSNSRSNVPVEPELVPARRMRFIFQMVWKPNTVSERIEAKKAREAAEAEAEATQEGSLDNNVALN